MLLMLSGPILIHLGAGPSLAIEALAWLIYTWMGIVLIFDTLALIADAARWLTPVRLQPTAGWTLILLLGLTAGLSLAAWQSARTIKTEQLMLRTAKLPVARLRIVQISDVHLGLLVRSERLGLILTAVRRARPDLLVSTGDLLDGELDGLDGLAEQLANISTPCGKFAVLGNHEFYAGAERAAAFTQQAGFRLLRNTSFSGVINIVGVDDPASGARPADLAKLFKGLDQRSFCLLLKHEPTRSAGRFDLQLSGHTHAGQIWPFGLLTRAVYGCNRGLYRLAGGRLLYVSRGSGTWGPQLRLGASPEVTVIDLIRN
ncbi:MAG: putative metallophosphoesterase [Deltaproteobacteria bacterium ADurb.Bin510]|nr:MAG: putative metallophosphoesterase [Deltaproteobacteria bacterium ADurb.Bin510]